MEFYYYRKYQTQRENPGARVITETQCVNTAWKVRSWVLSAMSQTEEKNPNPLSQNRYSSPSIREKMGKRAKEGTEGKEKRERERGESPYPPPPSFSKIGFGRSIAC